MALSTLVYKTNKIKALNYWAKSCELGCPTACLRAGSEYRYEYFDYNKAVYYYKKGCELGFHSIHAQCCFNAGWLYEDLGYKNEAKVCDIKASKLGWGKMVEIRKNENKEVSVN
jgi:TPR repeat protein